MIAPINSWLDKHRRARLMAAAHFKLWTLFLLLIAIGFGGGYTLEYIQSNNTREQIVLSKNAEISRLQSINVNLLDTINTRLPPLTQKIDAVSGQVGQAAEKLDQATDASIKASRRADQAAQTAAGAAVNAARANIRNGPTPLLPDHPE